MWPSYLSVICGSSLCLLPDTTAVDGVGCGCSLAVTSVDDTSDSPLKKSKLSDNNVKQ